MTFVPHMTAPPRPGTRLALDEGGFVVDPSCWTRETAGVLADLNGIGVLTAEHWCLISYIRDYYARFGAVPLMRRVCRSQNLDRAAIKQLFGSCQTAWRIAGLPDPGEEAKAYMA